MRTEFHARYAARTVVEFADECARLAAAWLVFSRTASVPLTALAYLLMAAPAVIFGQARRPARLGRGVPVALDLVRTALIALLAWTGFPQLGWWAAVALFGLASRYRAVTWPRSPVRWPAVSPYIRLSGFTIGGLLSLAFGPRPVLAIGAALLAIGAILAARPERRQHRKDGCDGGCQAPQLELRKGHPGSRERLRGDLRRQGQ